MTIKLFQHNSQMEQEREDYLVSYSNCTHSISSVVFNDNSDINYMDDYVKNLCWSGEQSADELTIYNSKGEVLDVSYWASWE